MATRTDQALSSWIAQVENELGSADVELLPTPKRAAALLRSLAEAPHPLAERIGPVWTAVHTRGQLDLTSRQALDNRRRSGSVLGVKTSGTGRVFYPVFQFRTVAGRVEVRPALAAVFKILRSQDPWAVAMLLTVPAPELDGLSPLAWERAGRPEAALAAYAQRIRRDWSR